MRVYKLEIIVVDHDGVGDNIGTYIEDARYPNHCIAPHVIGIESRDIGEWSDDHPLNKNLRAESAKLFATDDLTKGGASVS